MFKKNNYIIYLQFISIYVKCLNVKKNVLFYTILFYSFFYFVKCLIILIFLYNICKVFSMFVKCF